MNPTRRHGSVVRPVWTCLANTLALLALLAAPAAPAGPATGPDQTGPAAWRLDLRPSAEVVGWAGDTPPPALLDFDEHAFLAPRLSLEAAVAAGDHWFGQATVRLDRGFDAGESPDGALRLDEAIVRWRPWADERLNVQIGKFPTVFGAWVGQHDFFDDPFLLPPLPYAQIIGINARDPGALAPRALAARAGGEAPPVATLSKQNWASMIWGPSYAAGAAVFGSVSSVDYAAEIKNASLSSHPDDWDSPLHDPALSLRLGWRPDAAWALGVSASRGPYLSPGVAGRDDLLQSALGVDVRWAHHDWILSGEWIASEFETAAAGDLQAMGWFGQARWKAAPGLWLAGRAGVIAFDEARGPDGRDVEWTPDVWRLEAAAGWRLTPRLLVKASYSFTGSSSDNGGPDGHLFGLGLGWRL
jgi:hypothetical protein